MAAIVQLLRLAFKEEGYYDPSHYIKALGETLAITILISLLITWLFNPEVLSNNPILRMMGYNNPCVAWDAAPAIYFAAPMFTLNAYWAIRYAVLDSRRVALNVDMSNGQKTMIYVVDWCFAFSMSIMILIFVVTPFDDNKSLTSMRMHMGFFVQFVPVRFICVAAHYWQAPHISHAQIAYLIIYGFFTAGLTTIAVTTMVLYKNDGVQVVNPILAKIADWGWFVCLPLTAKFLPETPLVHIRSTLVGMWSAERFTDRLGKGMDKYEGLCKKEPSFNGVQGLCAHADGTNWERKRGADAIICPVLAALYSNGDLETDADGMCNRNQLKVALCRTGCRNEKLLDSLTAPAADGPINIFNMDGRHQHQLSTGIRDAGAHNRPVPDKVVFDQLVSFAQNGRMHAAQLKQAVDYFKKEGYRPTEGVFKEAESDDVLVRIIAGTLEAFGRDDEHGHKYLTVDDLRMIYLENRYPIGWEHRIHEWGLGQVLGDSIALRTGGACEFTCCNVQPSTYVPIDGEDSDCDDTDVAEDNEENDEEECEDEEEESIEEGDFVEDRENDY